jgi:putative transposase
VVGRCYQQHRAVEFRRFLATVKRAVPAAFGIHLVLDNYATHKAPPVKAWRQTPAPSPAFHTHQRLLAQPSGRLVRAPRRQVDRARRPSQRARTKAAIAAFIEAHNDESKPFL